MTEREYRTGIGTSDADSISLLGHDLPELLGTLGFAELAYWLICGRRPSSGEARVFDAVLVALADHGFTPTAIAARMTYYSAPESLQGALAAGLLGSGSRFLGVTEDTGTYLAAALGRADTAEFGASDWDRLATEAIIGSLGRNEKIPGLGHPVHKTTDPRTHAIVVISRDAGVYGPHLALFEAIGRVHPGLLGRTLPLNGAGVSGAALADAGVPPQLLRGVALLARTAGLLGHLAEERREPVAPDIYFEIDRHAVYAPPSVQQETTQRKGKGPS